MKRESGASVLEYTILVALVVLVVVGAMTALGRDLNNKLPQGMAPGTTALPPSTVHCPTTTSSTTAPPTSPTTSSTTAPPTTVRSC